MPLLARKWFFKLERHSQEQSVVVVVTRQGMIIHISNHPGKPKEGGEVRLYFPSKSLA